MFIYGKDKLNGFEYIELQVNKNEGELTKINANDIKHWKDDSIYVSFNNIDEFILFSNKYLGNALYLNNEVRPIDIYGINFFSKEKVNSLLTNEDLNDVCKEFIVFLKEASKYNGFFILGL